MIKLTKQGFSAIEILVAVVAVVVVAGLGYFAYSSWSGSSSNSETTQSTEAKEDGEITSDSEAEAAQADAGRYTSVKPVQSGRIKVGAAVCRYSTGLKVIFLKSPAKPTYTDSRPVLVLTRSGKRTGQIYGAQKWWLGYVQQVQAKTGKHYSTDMVKVLYAGRYSPGVKWGQISAC